MAVKNDRHAGVPLIHKVETLQLPLRLVTDAEYAEVKAAQMRNVWHDEFRSEAAARIAGRPARTVWLCLIICSACS